MFTRFVRMTALAGVALIGGVSALGPGAPAAEAQIRPPAQARVASGANAASIQAAVDAFRADLGGVNNGAGGSFLTGRREVNWDGVPDAFSSPNAFPGNFFNANSPRGIEFFTAGGGFQVSARDGNPTATPVRFGNIDPSYTATFSTFSPQRLFTSVGSNVIDILFFVPGTSTPATVSGFGSVFTDVDTADRTRIEYFDAAGRSLGLFGVPVGPSGGLSFIGVMFSSERGTSRIARVRITSGNRVLGPGVVDGGTNDVVVMDDFIYGEPRP